ncbi:MAG: GNAT family N-acetyltransferase, partial [Actinomycetota bacterium]|nr:GNAT family N-acetyltransferase [Actinomycetota bacterium]
MHTVDVGGRAFTVVSHAECPDLETAAQGEDFLAQWPQFMFHDAVAAEHYPTMFARYPGFQFYIQDDDGTVVVSGNSIPLAWNGTSDDLPTGWDDGLTRGALGVLGGVEPNTLCAIQATLSARFVGQGLGAMPVRAMRNLALDAGFDALIAPVRPSYKARYPLTDIGRYATWRR